MKSANLLVIEDDLDIASSLRYELELAGYTVRVAGSVIQGLTQAREQLPDLVLLDLGLPDGDGRGVLSRLRVNSNVPVIVLTALDAVEDKVELLALGADDYVVKPFQIEELLARIGVQLRQDAPQVLAVAGLELYPDRRLAMYEGREVHFSPKEFELLSVLMSQPGRVYSRKDLIQAVWQGALPEGSNVVDVHFANLRGKLRDVELYGLLRTVRGVGYALRS